MTPADLDRLEALLGEATPGPWRRCGEDRGGCECGLIWSVPGDAPVASTNTDSPEEGFSSTKERKIRDAALIAVLRNAAPDLIAAARERDALRAELAEARRERDTLDKLASDAVRALDDETAKVERGLATMERDWDYWIRHPKDVVFTGIRSDFGLPAKEKP